MRNCICVISNAYRAKLGANGRGIMTLLKAVQSDDGRHVLGSLIFLFFFCLFHILDCIDYFWKAKFQTVATICFAGLIYDFCVKEYLASK